MIGKTLAHYEVTGKLGKGGMGEVYQAKDQKLGREVAIKVLPEEFARDSDRVARFQREAKLLASLNHPNIAAIHGLEESEGTKFLVLELVEGETLAEQLKRGPIPAEESLKLALQIAEALEAAHEKGVIHRDLKPANIKVTPGGRVKVLDFGLAKAFAGEKDEVNLSNSPTLSDAATQQGVILGTAAYMSPEQARGKSVDKRTDIFAFGCVLFEMLAGRAAFSGKDVTDILAAVIRSEPEWGNLPANLHGRLREVITRCLKKEPKDRYHDISDVRMDIQSVLADPSGVFAQPRTGEEARIRPRKLLPWIAAAIAFGAVIAGIAVWKLRPAEPRQVMRFDYDIPEDQQFVTTSLPVIAVSPNGRQFVYSTTKGLYLRSVDELTAKLVAGTEGPTVLPFYSPDGKWIAYGSVSDRKLKKISANGGAPVILCNIATVAGASWNEDNTIVFGQYPGPIMRVSANGGTPEAITKSTSETHIAPQILPGGKSLLFTAAASTGQGRVMVQSLKSGETKELFAGFAARYLPTGHIVYGLPNNNNRFAVPFDLDRLEVKGGAVPIVEGVLQGDISNAGTLVYLPGAAAAAEQGRTLVWVNREGKEEAIPAPPKQYMFPKISPDGTQVAFSITADGNQDIWVWDLIRKTLTRLTFDKGIDLSSVWTLDGKRIIFRSSRDSRGLYWKTADGTGKDELLCSAPGLMLLPYSVSKDGKLLAVVATDMGSKWDVGIVSLEGDHAYKPLLKEDYVEVQPQISPDGNWIAYTSNESGREEVFVRPFPDVNKGGRWQISTNGGSSAIWSPNGREIFYLSSEDGSVMVNALETTPAFRPGTPRPLFKGAFEGPSASSGTPWDIHPDGKRFLRMKPPGATPSAAAAPRKIHIVLNWFEELKQRAPVK